MAAIRLLSAPVEPPSALEFRSQSTGLVSAPRVTLTSGSTSRTDSVYRSDNDVWSVSVSDDGSFNFYAAPRKSSPEGVSNQLDNFLSARAFATDWNTPQMLNAAVQYAIQAQAPNLMFEHSIDVYV